MDHAGVMNVMITGTADLTWLRRIFLREALESQSCPHMTVTQIFVTYKHPFCVLPIQALCTEASLAALRRTYPQIYESDDKLLIDPAAVAVTPRDFFAAHAALTPASHRSAAAHARSAPPMGSTAACTGWVKPHVL